MQKPTEILFLTSNRYLFRKAELELAEKANLTRAETFTPKAAEGKLLFVDLDTATPAPFPSDALFLSHSEEALSGRLRRLLLPCPVGAFCSLLTAEKKREAMLTLLPKQRSARLSGREIRLTELEYALLERLISADGSTVGRSEIETLFPAGSSASMTNVYIHYLREKLETAGEKIILSVRGGGYRISEKYLRPEDAGKEDE